MIRKKGFIISTRVFNILLFSVFSATLIVTASFHEFWRDELQAWMIAHYSHSFHELFFNSRYDGHPSLWFILLFLLKQVSQSLMAMKALHVCIALVSAILLIRYSPFNRITRFLVIFGYFFLYEYAVISRNYAIGVMLLFTFCSLFRFRHQTRYFYLLVFILAVLMQASFYSFFLACCLAMVLFVEVVFNKGSFESGSVRKIFPSLLIILAGILLFITDTLPPPDYGYAAGWNLSFDRELLTTTIDRVWDTFVPVPQPVLHFWNSNIIVSPDLRAWLAILLLPELFYCLIRKKMAMLLFYSGLLILMAFNYFKFHGYMRHNGHIFLLFIVTLWLQYYLPGKEVNNKNFARFMLYGILAIQVIACVMVIGCELTFRFSQAEYAADYIRKNRGNEYLVIGHNDSGASSVSAYLERTFYYPRSKRFGTFILWDQRRENINLSIPGFVSLGTDAATSRHQKPLFLITAPIENPGQFGLVEDARFEPSVEPFESYYIYELSGHSE